MNPEEEIVRINKRIRNISKKLKEISDLEEKERSCILNETQKEKIGKKAKLEVEMQEQERLLQQKQDLSSKLQQSPENTISTEFVKKMMSIFHIRQMKKTGYLQKLKVQLSEYESDILDKFFVKLYCVDYSQNKDSQSIFAKTAEELDLLFKRSLKTAVEGKSYDFVFKIIHRINCKLEEQDETDGN